MSVRRGLRERLLSASGRTAARVIPMDGCALFRRPGAAKVRDNVFLPSPAGHTGTSPAVEHEERLTAACAVTNMPGLEPLGRADTAPGADHRYETPDTRRVVHEGRTVGTVAPDPCDWASPVPRQSVVVTWPEGTATGSRLHGLDADTAPHETVALACDLPSVAVCGAIIDGALLTVARMVPTDLPRIAPPAHLPIVGGRERSLSRSRRSGLPPVQPVAGGPPDSAPPLLTREMLMLLAPPPASLLTVLLHWPSDLYPFQVIGAQFLAKRKHALLADDMGLGKTVQAIAALRFLFASGVIRNALIVCPANLRANWAREFGRWAEDVACLRVDGDAASRRVLWASRAHVWVTSYDSLVRDVGSCGLRGMEFDVVVLDEAQRIKNPSTKTAATVTSLQRTVSWCLTGTPIENRFADLWSIFGFVHAGAREDWYENDDWYSVEGIRDAIAPYFLRRRKAEVLPELPPKRVVDRILELTSRQRRAYAEAWDSGRAVILEGARKREVTFTHVFALITRLKQICNFDAATGASCKFEHLQDVADSVIDAGDKLIVFSQFVETIRFLERHLGEHRPFVFTGSDMTQRQREDALRGFDEAPHGALLLISLRAGGVGLNLQAATWVVHFDRWWNPAVESQAEDRAHRIGQTRELTVERLICYDTIESRIHAIQEEKRRMFAAVMDAEAVDGTETLTPGEMLEVLDLDPRLADMLHRSPGGTPDA